MKPSTIGFFLRALFLLLMTACSDDSPAPAAEEEGLAEHPAVFVILPPNGPGDNGYLDKMLSATMIYTIAHPGEVCIVIPQNPEEAAQIYNSLDFLILGNAMPDTVLSVFVGSEYKESLYRAEAPKSRHKVLLIEDDGEGAPEWLNTCMIERYGVCYLAGAMVGQRPASVIAAMPGDQLLERSLAGFRDGLASIGGKEPDSVYYLSDGYDGFKMQEKAQMLTDSIDNAHFFICHTLFPLAGFANQGVYNAASDVSLLQIIGMDKDYSHMSDKIPFSIVYAVDSLLLDCLNRWDAGESMPKRRMEGLDSPYIQMVFNERWNSNGILYNWENPDDIFEPGDEFIPVTVDFWKERRNKFMEKAIREEKAYAIY